MVGQPFHQGLAAMNYHALQLEIGGRFYIIVMLSLWVCVVNHWQQVSANLLSQAARQAGLLCL
jgi:hypothetical protein